MDDFSPPLSVSFSPPVVLAGSLSRCVCVPQGEAEGRRGVPGSASQRPGGVDGESGCEERRSQGRHPALSEEGQRFQSEVRPSASALDRDTSETANQVCDILSEKNDLFCSGSNLC